MSAGVHHEVGTGSRLTAAHQKEQLLLKSWANLVLSINQ